MPLFSQFVRQPLRNPVLLAVATLPALCGLPHSTAPARPNSVAATAQRRALEKFNSLIGGWRGVGMPRRNSTRGAWIETAEWVWSFQDGKTAIVYVVKNGKQLQSARLTFDEKTKRYNLSAKFANKIARRYTGRIAGKKLVLDSAADKNGAVYRITITRLNEKRTLVLHERRRAKATQFFRIAEVGYTRKGTSLAVAGAGGPECVVTGGKGTTRVTYKGKTYYVCCSGCKQAFDDDPEGVLADYRGRVAARKKKRK
ncbi:MAG: YHS domain-containing protein [Planctomycetaceae bacterium]